MTLIDFIAKSRRADFYGHVNLCFAIANLLVRITKCHFVGSACPNSANHTHGKVQIEKIVLKIEFN